MKGGQVQFELYWSVGRGETGSEKKEKMERERSVEKKLLAVVGTREKRERETQTQT